MKDMDTLRMYEDSYQEASVSKIITVHKAGGSYVLQSPGEKLWSWLPRCTGFELKAEKVW